MDISLAFGSFVILVGAWAIAGRRRSQLHSVPEEAGSAGEAGFLRRLAS